MVRTSRSASHLDNVMIEARSYGQLLKLPCLLGDENAPSDTGSGGGLSVLPRVTKSTESFGDSTTTKLSWRFREPFRHPCERPYATHSINPGDRTTPIDGLHDQLLHSYIPAINSVGVILHGYQERALRAQVAKAYCKRVKLITREDETAIGLRRVASLHQDRKVGASSKPFADANCDMRVNIYYVIISFAATFASHWQHCQYLMNCCRADLNLLYYGWSVTVRSTRLRWCNNSRP